MYVHCTLTILCVPLNGASADYISTRKPARTLKRMTEGRVLVMIKVTIIMLTVVMFEDLPDSAQSMWNTRQGRRCAPKSSRLNKNYTAVVKWMESLQINSDQRMNKSEWDEKHFLLPENFALRLVSARSTEASGLDERTLWANEHDAHVFVIEILILCSFGNFHNTHFFKIPLIYLICKLSTHSLPRNLILVHIMHWIIREIG